MSKIILPAVKWDSVLQNDRPKIGLLIESLSGSYQSGVWPGIKSVAETYGVNIICFTGGALNKSPDDPWEKNRNIMYDMAEKSQLHGVIISGTLCSYVTDDEINQFLDRFKHIPAVTLLPFRDDIPSVFVNNRRGMRELVDHLVQKRNYKRFAFIRGPVGNPEAEERLNILTEELNKFSIRISEDDIVAGDFNRASGARAVENFLKSGNGEIPYDVIVCADDETAYGAIQALRSNNLEVPDDIAVVGFDDEKESSYITPPLTTVHQPLFELGQRACQLILEKISGIEVPPHSVLDAKLVVRQSCGNFDHIVKKATIRKALMESVSAHNSISADVLEDFVLSKMKLKFDLAPFDYMQIHEIIHTFVHDINLQKSVLFLQAFDRIGRIKILKGSNLIIWNELLSILWFYILSHLDRETFSFADALLHRARIIRGNLVLRAQGYRRIEAQREYVNTHQIGEQISHTVEIDKLLELISQELPMLGLDTFYLSLYKDPSDPLNQSQLVLAVEKGEVIFISSQSPQTYKTEKLLPVGSISTGDAHNIISEPLYFHNELFGIIYFVINGNVSDVNLFEVFGTYISMALHSRYLINKVEKQADALRIQNAELEELRKKEHAYLQAIKNELEIGRKIQRSFLPEEIFQPSGYNISVDFNPAREVSGDFYDVFPIDSNNISIIVADVSGKDVSAALFMSLVKTLIRVYSDRAVEAGEDPLETLSLVNEYIIRHHHQQRGRCMFATLLYGVLNIETGDFSYINAGHNPSLLFDQNGEIKDELRPCAPAIGLAPGFEFPIKKSVINPGEFLFSYTDGVTEAQNNQSEFFTLERTIELLKAEPIIDSDGPIDRLKEALAEFSKGTPPFDDITMLGIFRKNS